MPLRQPLLQWLVPLYGVEEGAAAKVDLAAFCTQAQARPAEYLDVDIKGTDRGWPDPRQAGTRGRVHMASTQITAARPT